MTDDTSAHGTHHVTFRIDSTNEIREYLNNGGTTIRITPHVDGAKWTATVFDATGIEMGTTNDTFPCPPFCG